MKTHEASGKYFADFGKPLVDFGICIIENRHFRMMASE